MKPKMKIENVIRKKAKCMSEYAIVAFLYREKIVSSETDQTVLLQMCRDEVSRQLSIRKERMKQRNERDKLAKEMSAKGRYQDLLELWRDRDEMWRRYSASGSSTIKDALKHWSVPGSWMVVSGFLIKFESDLLAPHTGFPRKTRRKQTNRRLEFFMYDHRNHRRVLVATVPVARWTERSVGIALFDTLAGLSPAWITAMTMENIYKTEIQARRLPPGRLPR